jgi:UDP-2,3-diacylglucosamine pyrophosphatase LpxH
MIKRVIDDRNYWAVIMLGDIHGEFYRIIEFMSRKHVNDSCIVQVGDFGVFNTKEDAQRLFKLNEHLIDKNNHLYVVRGNHDNPTFFKGVDFFGLSNIHFVEDYTILTLNWRNFFCFGGAHSINRKSLVLGFDYFADCPIQYDGTQDLSEVTDIHYVVTHTAPQLFPPFVFDRIVEHFCAKDPDLRLDITHERALMNLMYQHLLRQNRDTLRVWFYGHFHNHICHEIDGIIARMLNINEFVEVELLA